MSAVPRGLGGVAERPPWALGQSSARSGGGGGRRWGCPLVLACLCGFVTRCLDPFLYFLSLSGAGPCWVAGTRCWEGHSRLMAHGDFWGWGACTCPHTDKCTCPHTPSLLLRVTQQLKPSNIQHELQRFIGLSGKAPGSVAGEGPRRLGPHRKLTQWHWPQVYPTSGSPRAGF